MIIATSSIATLVLACAFILSSLKIWSDQACKDMGNQAVEKKSVKQSGSALGFGSPRPGGAPGSSSIPVGPEAPQGRTPQSSMSAKGRL